MKLEIDSIDFKDEAFQPIVTMIAKSVADGFKLQKKRDELPAWMTKKQACEYINCSYNKLIDLIHHGLKVANINGYERISKTAIDEFMRDHEN